MSARRLSSPSPPPVKRQKLSESKFESQTSTQRLSVYSWNVNGIQPFLQQPITSFFRPDDSNGTDNVPSASLRDFLRRHDWPTFLFLQEIKVRPNDEATIRALEKAVKAQKGSGAIEEPDYVVHVCLPSDKQNARGFGGRVYGVASIIRRDFHERHVKLVRSVDWDSEGRILVVETDAVGFGPKLAVCNLYMVNGTDHPYITRADTGAVVGTRHERKRQVHGLLQAECRKLEAEGFGIVLAGDMNIARTRIDGHPNLRTYPHQHVVNRADFEARIFSASELPPQSTKGSNDHPGAKQEMHADAGLGMIDTFRCLHPETRGYTYYPRGRAFGESCDRVDMVIISAALKQFLVAAGMHETPAERGPSDHVPLYARFHFEREKDSVQETRGEGALG